MRFMKSVFLYSYLSTRPREPAACEVLFLKEPGMPRDKGMQLSRHPIEMVGHLVSCLIRLARRNRAIDRFMLAEGSLRAPRLGKKSSAHPFKMGPDRVKHVANPSCERVPTGSKLQFSWRICDYLRARRLRAKPRIKALKKIYPSPCVRPCGRAFTPKDRETGKFRHRRRRIRAGYPSQAISPARGGSAPT